MDGEHRCGKEGGGIVPGQDQDRFAEGATPAAALPRPARSFRPAAGGNVVDSPRRGADARLDGVLPQGGPAAGMGQELVATASVARKGGVTYNFPYETRE